jgi:hypothetical protein
VDSAGDGDAAAAGVLEENVGLGGGLANF